MPLKEYLSCYSLIPRTLSVEGLCGKGLEEETKAMARYLRGYSIPGGYSTGFKIHIFHRGSDGGF